MNNFNAAPYRRVTRFGGFGLLLFGLFVIFAQTDGAGATPAGGQPPQELIFLNWIEYLDPALVERFERRHNVRIKQAYFASDDGRGYDLAIVNGVQLGAYRRRGWLAPVRLADVPNLRHVDPRWATAFAAADGYAVPYFWGTLGIAYRADLAPTPLTRWQQLFEPEEGLRNKITMIRHSKDIIGMALKSLGYSANSPDRDELAAAERLLLRQRPFVKNYEYVDISKNSDLVTGQAVAAMAYSGDALLLRDLNGQVVYVVPEEGCNLWVDYITVLASSTQKELAYAFIDFLNEPENAARLAQFVYYPSPNAAAEPHLPAGFLADPLIYPSAAALAKCEVYQELPPRALRQRNGLYRRVMPY